MKKRYLALLIVGPIILLCISSFIRYSERGLLSTNVKTLENVQLLKQRALQADKETNPQARIEVLSTALIRVAEANVEITEGNAQAFHGMAELLEWLAILQILFSICVFRQLRSPNHRVQPTPKTGAADAER